MSLNMQTTYTCVSYVSLILFIFNAFVQKYFTSIH